MRGKIRSCSRRCVTSAPPPSSLQFKSFLIREHPRCGCCSSLYCGDESGFRGAASRRSIVDHREVGRYWNDNADTWTRLARAGYDIYRDFVNTPAFFEMLPDVSGLRVLDIGCGERYNTRLLAERGARVV